MAESCEARVGAAGAPQEESRMSQAGSRVKTGEAGAVRRQNLGRRGEGGERGPQSYTWEDRAAVSRKGSKSHNRPHKRHKGQVRATYGEVSEPWLLRDTGHPCSGSTAFALCNRLPGSAGHTHSSPWLNSSKPGCVGVGNLRGSQGQVSWTEHPWVQLSQGSHFTVSQTKTPRESITCSKPGAHGCRESFYPAQHKVEA